MLSVLERYSGRGMLNLFSTVTLLNFTGSELKMKMKAIRETKIRVQKMKMNFFTVFIDPSPVAEGRSEVIVLPSLQPVRNPR